MTEVRSPTTYTFPAFVPSEALPEDEPYQRNSSRSPAVHSQYANGSVTQERWQARRQSQSAWRHEKPTQGARHSRQKSITEAIRTIRTRKGSLSQNAHEIADALKVPLSPQIIILCGVWYITSVLSNTSSKAILTALPKPITLTVVQFAFVSSWCLVFSYLAKIYPRLKTLIPALKHGIRRPSRDIITATLPLTLFQIGGHILGSAAMKEIPVSLVHTIKGLSPLLTVLAYRIFFNIRYSTPVYLSLVPLTGGVILACSANFSASLLGFLYAFGSAILFVTQNIVSKSIFNEAALAEAEGTYKARKPDKLNLLYYSSGLAFLLTFPLWLWSEGFTLLRDLLSNASVTLSEKPGSLDHGRLTLEFIFNGSFHFGQNLVAFILLSLVSPVTYSVASLLKRVFVICFAIIWFGNNITPIQSFGIALTFLGLYLYDRTNHSAKADRKARTLQLRDHNYALPLVADGKNPSSSSFGRATHSAVPPPTRFTSAGLMGNFSQDDKKNDDYLGGPGRAGSSGPGRSGGVTGTPSPSNAGGWLPPGYKQENTWISGDQNNNDNNNNNNNDRRDKKQQQHQGFGVAVT